MPSYLTILNIRVPEGVDWKVENYDHSANMTSIETKFLLFLVSGVYYRLEQNTEDHLCLRWALSLWRIW